jgi:hypothetical protein
LKAREVQNTDAPSVINLAPRRESIKASQADNLALEPLRNYGLPYTIRDVEIQPVADAATLARLKLLFFAHRLPDVSHFCKPQTYALCFV